MAKHQLFLLKPGFYDGEEGPYYCPYSAAIEGMLKYVPDYEDNIEIHRIDYPRPRPVVKVLLGEENQGTPVLVLAEGSEIPENAKVSEETGRAFLDDTQEIGEFLGGQFGEMIPH